METEQEKSQFETQRIGTLLRRFALPAIISMMVSSLYNIVDQIFIGWGVGYFGNAATNVVFPFVVLVMGVAYMIGDGSAAYFSLKLGEGRMQAVKASVGNALILSSVAGVFFMVLGLLFLQPIFRLLGATDAVLAYAMDYGRIIMIGLPFASVGMTLASIIRADGSPGFTMSSMLAGAIANTILDPLFIFVFGWGVQGAAWATVLGQMLSFALNVRYLKHFKSIRIEKNMLRFQPHTAKRIVLLGVSTFIWQFAVTVVMVVMNNALTHYGAQSVYGSEIPLATLGIVMKMCQIMMAIVVGLAVGAQPIIGYNYGAKNYHRVKKTYSLMMGIGLAVASVGFLIFQFAPQLLINIFGTGEALYNEFAVKCFRIFLAACVFIGFNDASAIYFQAAGKPVHSAALSLMRQLLFFIPVLLILPKFLGIDGVLFAGPIADTLAFVFSMVLVSREMKRLSSMEEQRQESMQEQQAVWSVG